MIPRCASRATTSAGSRPSTSKQTRPADSEVALGVRRLTPRTPRQARLKPRDERADPRFHPPAADRLVEAERLGKRPPVLEGVEPARRQPRAVGGTAGSTAGEPRSVALAVVERRDDRPHELASPRPHPEDAGPTRAVQPLVAAGCERVAAQAPRRVGLGGQAVNAVDAHEHPVRQGVGDLAQRELDAGARVHPGKGHDPCSTVTARLNLVTISSTVACRESS